MAVDNSDRSNHQVPILREASWIAVALWLLPVPIFAFAASAATATAALICFIWASTEASVIGWILCAMFAATSAVIAAASVARLLHRRRHATPALARYESSEQRPSIAILVLLISVYSWMLILGLHIFRNFFAANAPGGAKYYVTLGIAIASSVYMSIHGRCVLREQMGPQRGRNIAITPVQALLVVLLTVGLGMYFAWIMV